MWFTLPFLAVQTCQHVSRFGHGDGANEGGGGRTRSLGCQTVPPEQWQEFFDLVKFQAKLLFGYRWGKETIPYILLDFAV